MMPEHQNPDGAIFGGQILALMDQAAYVEALRQCNHQYVTVAFRGVEFHKAVMVGDVLSVYAEAQRIGRTSITVKVRVEVFRPSASEHIEVTTGEVVLVAIDHAGKPQPIFDDAGG
jgi:acyl-CoA thioesterase YciA